jgi:hypothetical protein
MFRDIFRAVFYIICNKTENKNDVCLVCFLCHVTASAKQKLNGA